MTAVMEPPMAPPAEPPIEPPAEPPVEVTPAQPPSKAAERADLVVIGAGIVGLATTYRLLQQHPALRIVVVDKEARVGAHQTGHNSGVIHAGLYYAPGSAKARFCAVGRGQLEQFAEQHGIAFERCGKLVVALEEDELPRLEAIRQKATANGVPGLEEVGPERIREIEPEAAGIRALWSPATGIIDFARVADALADEIRALGATIELGRAVTGIERRPGEMVVATTRGSLAARNVIACAGLWSDRVAAMTGDAGKERIVPFRGDYYTLKPEARSLVRGLIYPVPDPRFPFLGVHFTKRIDGEVWAGPNAVLAFARDGYRRWDIDPAEVLSILNYRGFRHVARRFMRYGASEMIRDWWKPAFTAELQRYVPAVEARDLTFGPSGVRAQSLDVNGVMVDDFSIGSSEHVLHVRNAPSPAATASLAIGEELARRATEQFGLGPGAWKA